MDANMVGGLLAGLVLFLWGLSLLSDALGAVSADHARLWLGRATHGRVLAFAAGFVATVLPACQDGPCSRQPALR